MFVCVNWCFKTSCKRVVKCLIGHAVSSLFKIVHHTSPSPFSHDFQITYFWTLKGRRLHADRIFGQHCAPFTILLPLMHKYTIKFHFHVVYLSRRGSDKIYFRFGDQSSRLICPRYKSSHTNKNNFLHVVSFSSSTMLKFSNTTM